jgi:uncharacterized SAM-binding protein YcdF (DUF218 family)
MQRLLEILVLPPAGPLLLLGLGSLLRRWLPRLGRGLQAAGLLLLVVLALPVTGGLLLASLQQYPALPATGPLPAAQAIVVLSADADRYAYEYAGPVAGPMTMQRLRYAATLQRRSGLPVLVSGGLGRGDTDSLASMMATAAKEEFGIPIRWQESESTTTWENAAHSARLLQRDGIRRVYLVTSAWHMPRAVQSFIAHGLEVVAAPTAFRAPAIEGWMAFLPSWSGMKDTSFAMHEWSGRLLYGFRRPLADG